MAYKSVDYLEFDSLLSEQELLVRSTARAFASECEPLMKQGFRDAKFPLDELKPQLGELGFFGANLEGYGCAGMSSVEYWLIMQELERCDSGLRSFLSVQGSLAMQAIHSYGSEEQKQKYLPDMAQGKIMGCFGLTEPAFGSNPSGMITRAVRDGNEYVINGEKTWITNGSIADVAVVWAKHDDTDEIRGFLVDASVDGFQASNIHNKLSMRASITSSLAFSDVRIPAENALPGAIGLKGALSCLSAARLGIGWGCVGAAESCFDCAAEYTTFRKQFNDSPIASHQLVQNELAWMITEITKAKFLALQVSRLKDNKREHFSQVSMLKRNNAWMALETARRARDLLGANGITDEFPIFRHMCNLETVKTYEGTHNIHTLVIGNRVTGVGAFV